MADGPGYRAEVRLLLDGEPCIVLSRAVADVWSASYEVRELAGELEARVAKVSEEALRRMLADQA